MKMTSLNARHYKYNHNIHFNIKTVHDETLSQISNQTDFSLELTYNDSCKIFMNPLLHATNLIMSTFRVTLEHTQSDQIKCLLIRQISQTGALNLGFCVIGARARAEPGQIMYLKYQTDAPDGKLPHIICVTSQSAHLTCGTARSLRNDPRGVQHYQLSHFAVTYTVKIRLKLLTEPNVILQIMSVHAFILFLPYMYMKCYPLM